MFFPLGLVGSLMAYGMNLDLILFLNDLLVLLTMRLFQ